MQTNKHFSVPAARRGFTLIELLTVIAIIGILAAIIIPTVSTVRDNANKAKTKSQFGQWSVALNSFKNEYGYYPDIEEAGHKLDHDAFFAELTGKTYDGQDPSDGIGNKKRLSFYTVSASEVSSTAGGDKENGKLKDAFGNTDFVVFIDTNRDGIIKGDELASVEVEARDGGGVTPVDSVVDPAVGVRGDVIFYSAGKGSDPKDIVYSW